MQRATGTSIAGGGDSQQQQQQPGDGDLEAGLAASPVAAAGATTTADANTAGHQHADEDEADAEADTEAAGEFESPRQPGFNRSRSKHLSPGGAIVQGSDAEKWVKKRKKPKPLHVSQQKCLPIAVCLANLGTSSFFQLKGGVVAQVRVRCAVGRRR
jgi:hypothetical protein